MKLKNYKLFLIVLFVFVGSNAFAQKGKVFIFEAKETSIGSYNTSRDLEGKNKGELIQMYVTRIRAINAIIPVVALTKDPNKTCEDLGIPKDKESKLESENKRRNEAGKAQEDFLKEFLSYADKSDITKGILLMEEMLKAHQQSKAN